MVLPTNHLERVILMKKLLTAAALAASFLAGGLTSLPTANADSHPRAYWMNRVCKTESSHNCFWAAGSHSFYNHKIGKIECIMYTNKAYAAKHDYCF